VSSHALFVLVLVVVLVLDLPSSPLQEWRVASGK